MECRVHKLIADVAVLSGDRVLLVRYRDVSSYDGQHGWFMPDDALQHLEHPDTAAARILRTQLGLAVDVRLSHVESFGDGSWHLVFHYRADLEPSAAVTPGENVAEAEWFGLDALPDRSEMAHEGWGLDVLGEVVAGPG
jgi:ADP-ribose pyrophosphatase YjhB (NUDIX family)